MANLEIFDGSTIASGLAMSPSLREGVEAPEGENEDHNEGRGTSESSRQQADGDAASESEQQPSDDDQKAQDRTAAYADDIADLGQPDFGL